jgi:dihydrofolate reductase
MTSDTQSKPPILITLVVAKADNGVIGRDGKLPWHISADLKFFKRMTLGKPVIMGRKTYESIGKPLPRRTNIVVTRDGNWRAEGVTVAQDLPSAFALAYEDAHRTGADEIAVIGGAEIYRQTLDKADRIYLTEVHGVFEGDARLSLDLSAGWRETARERQPAETPDGPDFSFVTLDRLSD